MVYTTVGHDNSGDVPNAAEFNAIAENFRSLRHGNDQLVKLYLTADQSVPNTTTEFLSWGAVVGTQVGSIWSAGNPDRLVSSVDAIYTINLNVEWLTSTTGERSIGIRRNSDAAMFNLPSNGANQGGGNQSGLLELFIAAGDYVRAFVRHTNGSTIGVHGGADDRTHVFMSLAGVL